MCTSVLMPQPMCGAQGTTSSSLLAQRAWDSGIELRSWSMAPSAFAHRVISPAQKTHIDWWNSNSKSQKILIISYACPFLAVPSWPTKAGSSADW